MRAWGSFAVAGLICGALAEGCAADAGADAANTTVRSVEVGVQAAPLLELQRACSDTVGSVYEKPTNLPALNDSRRGDIVRCAPDETISKDVLANALSQTDFRGVTVQRGVRVYRISYRTKRFDGSADVSSALVALPVSGESGESDDDVRASSAQAAKAAGTSATTDRRRRPPASDGDDDDDDDDDNTSGPIVVYAHGTAPFGTSCAYSRSDPLRNQVFGAPDLELLSVLAYASQGWPTVMPDFPGFVQGSRVTGYMFSEDEAHALLDATHAMRKLLEKPREQVIMVGHSQGGHAALSAQALAKSYGMSGRLAGVAAFAPFWAPAKSFGAVLGSGIYQAAQDDFLGSYVLTILTEYFYTHAELYDRKGLDMFSAPSGAVQEVLNSCTFEPTIYKLGAAAGDFIKPAFIDTVFCAATGASCEGTDPAQVQAWRNRYKKDRPTLDRNGAPVVLLQGLDDKIVTSDLAGCGIAKIRDDFKAPGSKASLSLCVDRQADHELIESHHAGWVMKWIKKLTLSGADPGACPDHYPDGVDGLVAACGFDNVD